MVFVGFLTQILLPSSNPASFLGCRRLGSLAAQSPGGLLLPTGVFSDSGQGQGPGGSPIPVQDSWGQGRSSSCRKAPKNGVMGAATYGLELNLCCNSFHGQVTFSSQMLPLSQKVHERESAHGRLPPRCQRPQLNYNDGNLHCQSPPG